jgi:hypothetical protein
MDKSIIRLAFCNQENVAVRFLKFFSFHSPNFL